MKRSPKAPRAPFPDRVQPDEVRSGGADNDLKLCRDSVEEVKPRHVDDDQPPHYAHPPPAAPAIDDRPPSQTNITSITASATSMALHQHHHHTYLTPSPEPLHHALAHHQLGLPVSTLSPPPHLVTPPECQQQHHSPLLETLLEHQTRLLNLLVLQPQHPLTGAAGVHPFSLEMSPTPTPPPSQGPQQQGLVVPGLEEERGRLRGVAVELARERERLEEERAAFGKEVWGFRTKVVMGGVDEALRMVEDANRVEEA
ncbi:hypothetical protein HK101_001975 [Irineochytrium annulatum]|nr:hypothetical protein HK101_001975 [Irineochytrium annulatum]